MVELFFIKRFIVEIFIPYAILFISIGYIIFELICPKYIREYFYLYSDKLYFKFIVRPFQQIKKYFVKFKLNLKARLKVKILKSREKKSEKEKIKRQKEFEANEKSKLKLNKKIDKVNKKLDKKNKKAIKKNTRKRFVVCLFKKVFRIKKKAVK